MKLSVLDQSPIISGHSAAQAIEETLELTRRAEHHAIGALADLRFSFAHFINAQGGDLVMHAYKG